VLAAMHRAGGISVEERTAWEVLPLALVEPRGAPEPAPHADAGAPSPYQGEGLLSSAQRMPNCPPRGAIRASGLGGLRLARPLAPRSEPNE